VLSVLREALDELGDPREILQLYTILPLQNAVEGLELSPVLDVGLPAFVLELVKDLVVREDSLHVAMTALV